jgi:guanidinoacetate N-methyltransferase
MGDPAMTRKIKRLRDFEIVLELKNEQFIRPPRDPQRNWLLNRALRELADDLCSLDSIASRFVPGAASARPEDLESAELAESDIMEDWQRPLMAAMAEIAARSRGDLLEVGFGRGISASLIQEHGVRSHTLIECNPTIAARFEQWRARYPNSEIRLVPGRWQDVIGELGEFDSIFFHTYALSEEESIDLLSESVTFAEHFFEEAARHLRPGGTFTYLTNEIDSLSRSHQRLIFTRFRSFRVELVQLELPEDVGDAWWADSMAVIEVTR